MKLDLKKILCVILGVVFGMSSLIIIFVSVTPKETEKNSIYYRAAVLEAVPYTNASLSIQDLIQKNLDVYNIAAKIAKKEGVDMIVFPESVLYFDLEMYIENRSIINSIISDIPDPKETINNPCDQQRFFQNHSLLRNLSCMAKTNSMYIVVNVVDFKKCKRGDDDESKIKASSDCFEESKCKQEDVNLYNTNVVFDRKGHLITRYYKKHLFIEPYMKTQKCPNSGNFETDFGNFTTIICFDIMFDEIVKVLENDNIENLAYPLYWYDHTPFIFFAPVFQQAFAYYYGINVLAADGHVPGTGSLGSGIFSGKNGALISTNQPDGKTKLLISNMPKYPKNYTLNLPELQRKRFHFENGSFIEAPIEDSMTLEEECEVKVIGPPKYTTKDYRCQSSTNLTEYKFKKLSKMEDFIELCSGSFCCSLTYKIRSMEEDYYLAVSANEFEMSGLTHFNFESCFVTRCESKDGYRCSSFKLRSKTVFHTAVLNGTFTRKYVFPAVVDSNVKLTNLSKWTFDGRSHIYYQNMEADSSLLFLGIFGKDDDISL